MQVAMGRSLCHNQNMSVEKQVAIVTGAGRGIGRATALRLAQAGAQVVLFSRTRSHLDETVAEIIRCGGHVLAIAGDVACEEDVQGLFQQVRQTYRHVDILINCAGIVVVRPFVEMDVATWDQVIGVNLRGTFLCCREAFRIMTVQKQGVIINLSSLSGVKGC